MHGGEGAVSSTGEEDQISIIGNCTEYGHHQDERIDLTDSSSSHGRVSADSVSRED